MKFTEEQIQFLLTKYEKDREYRRLYYSKKYKENETYRHYIRDYNKNRYEDVKFAKWISEGGSEEQGLKNKADGFKKYFSRNGRMEDFQNKFPDVFNLLN